MRDDFFAVERFEVDFRVVDLRPVDFRVDFFAVDRLVERFVVRFVPLLRALDFFAVRLRVCAAFFAEALRLRFAALFDLPRADCLLTVAQARRSASSSLTPFSS